MNSRTVPRALLERHLSAVRVAYTTAYWYCASTDCPLRSWAHVLTRCGISTCVGHPSKNNGKCPVQDINAERSHWGLWCIVSSPLVLGFDMAASATMDRVLHINASTEAWGVNHAWAGKTGTLANLPHSRPHPGHRKLVHQAWA